MPSWIYMRGDPDAIIVKESPDVVMQRIEEAGEGFITVAGAPYSRDDEPRSGYVRASDIAAVLAMHPRSTRLISMTRPSGTRCTCPTDHCRSSSEAAVTSPRKVLVTCGGYSPCK